MKSVSWGDTAPKVEHKPKKAKQDKSKLSLEIDDSDKKPTEPIMQTVVNAVQAFVFDHFDMLFILVLIVVASVGFLAFMRSIMLLEQFAQDIYHTPTKELQNLIDTPKSELPWKEFSIIPKETHEKSFPSLFNIHIHSPATEYHQYNNTENPFYHFPTYKILTKEDTITFGFEGAALTTPELYFPLEDEEVSGNAQKKSKENDKIANAYGLKVDIHVSYPLTPTPTTIQNGSTVTTIVHNFPRNRVMYFPLPFASHLVSFCELLCSHVLISPSFT
jgi:hypothetical protein